MTAGSNQDSVGFIYKRKYDNQTVADMSMREHPLYSRIRKIGGFTGDSGGKAYVIKTGNPQGVSNTFSSAQAAASGSKGKQPRATRSTKYGIITLDGEAMAACEDDGAFWDLVTNETDGIIEELGDSMAFDLYRDGTGARGRISSINGQVLTLTVADDVRNFKEDMTIVGDNNSSGASPNAGSAVVESIDEDSGTITLEAGGVAAANLVNNDYLFRLGDGGTCVEGLALCTPLTAPTAGDSFRGIDRSSNVRRLAGIRINDTGNPIEYNLGLAAVNVKRIAQSQDEVYLNPINFFQISQRANAKVVYEGGGDATIGFQTIQLATAAGMLKLVSDPDCPVNRAYGVRMSEHYLWHLKEFPHVIKDGDGKTAMKSVDEDSIEIRIRAWWNYVQRRPGCFSVVAV